MAKLFSSRHKGTKTRRKNNKIKSFVSLWQISLGSGLSGLGFNQFKNFIALFFHLICLCFIFFMIITQQVKDAVH